ncbi:MAG: hypothetical protein M0Q88_01075 [Bacilli bacterium]|nr:hypothetical protein [Bacilli bacterium]
MARPLYPGEKNEHSTSTTKHRKKGIRYLLKKIRFKCWIRLQKIKHWTRRRNKKWH